MVVGCWLLAVVCWLLVVGCWLLVVVVVGNPPRPQKGGNHLVGGDHSGGCGDPCSYIYIYTGWWFGTFSHILGLPSSQLTFIFFIFFRGVAQSPTNIHMYMIYLITIFGLGFENVASAGNALGVPGQLPLGEYTCAAILPLNTYQLNVCIYIWVIV